MYEISHPSTGNIVHPSGPASGGYNLQSSTRQLLSMMACGSPGSSSSTPNAFLPSYVMNKSPYYNPYSGRSYPPFINHRDVGPPSNVGMGILPISSAEVLIGGCGEQPSMRRLTLGDSSTAGGSETDGETIAGIDGVMNRSSVGRGDGYVPPFSVHFSPPHQSTNGGFSPPSTPIFQASQKPLGGILGSFRVDSGYLNGLECGSRMNDFPTLTSSVIGSSGSRGGGSGGAGGAYDFGTAMYSGGEFGDHNQSGSFIHQGSTVCSAFQKLSPWTSPTSYLSLDPSSACKILIFILIYVLNLFQIYILNLLFIFINFFVTRICFNVI